MSETPAMSKLLGLQAKREKKGVGGAQGLAQCLEASRYSINIY